MLDGSGLARCFRRGAYMEQVQLPNSPILDEPREELLGAVTRDKVPPDDGRGARSHTGYFTSMAVWQFGSGGVGVQRWGRRLVFVIANVPTPDSGYSTVFGKATELHVLDGSPWDGATAVEPLADEDLDEAILPPHAADARDAG